MNIKRQLCEVYQRTCGWMSPRSAVNKGKLSEIIDRKTYKIKKKKNE
jgi:anaerobic ribonucleoside-triphosphate reductase